MTKASRLLLLTVAIILPANSVSSTGSSLWLAASESPLPSPLLVRPEPFLGLPGHATPLYSRPQPSRVSFNMDSRLRGAISLSILSGGLYVALDRKSREWVKTKWEFTFSPNHAQAANKGPFRFRTHQEELSQVSHIDKWCHFAFSYLPFEPLTLYSQRFLEGLPGWLGGVEKKGEISGRAVLVSTAIITGGSILEEYLDGFQKDEGFSVHDLACNLGGVALGVLRHKGHLENLRVYWRFTGAPKGWRYPWFDYMPGYATIVLYDFSELLFGKREAEEHRGVEFARFVGYLPPYRREEREFHPWIAPIW